MQNRSPDPLSRHEDRPSILVETPAVSIPKGGGAVRGIGETFRVNPANGGAAFHLPLPLSPGRQGLGPKLSLPYNSAAGNGVFGFGWRLDSPGISRKTDKKLPRYDDLAESDVFVWADAEDLVPVLQENGDRFDDRSSAPGFLIHRYRPRIEAAFARIERWTRSADGDVHWRSLSRDNVLSVYGKDAQSRIADPVDPSRVFSWLICETRDDRGNAVVYDYKPDDGAGIDLTLAHQRQRGAAGDTRRTVNRYLKRIRYGNRVPLLDSAGRRPRDLNTTSIEDANWMFEVLFDYGEHDPEVAGVGEVAPWTLRPDAFSTYRPGFEVRTTRRCRRVLMFHHFEPEAGVGRDCLVRSVDFTYAGSMHSFVRGVTVCGFRRAGKGYVRRALPSLELEYTEPIVEGSVREVDASSLRNLPAGLDGTTHVWTDLHGEGIPGVLSEQGGAWHYMRNLSPKSDGVVTFAPLERVATTPNVPLAGRAQLLDLAGDGQNDLVVFDGPTPGVHRHDSAEGWTAFRPFVTPLNRRTSDPNLRFVDLDGDGRADVLITEDDALLWHPSLAEDGFGHANRTPFALDEEDGPRLVFADASQSVYVADMNGDGLVDLVRVRNGEVSYWPNLGYGRFGAKVTMDRAPHLDEPDAFDQRRLRIADVDGSGTADLIYLSDEGAAIYFNESGNQWSAAQRVAFPRVDNVAGIQAIDLMGNGTACLVWSSVLPGDAGRQMRYVDLMGGQKPHLLTRIVNNLGAETLIHYAPSTRFYLMDKLAGQPWITRLPFPVQVVERSETIDRVSGNRFVTRYAYHHGHFDGTEREFRGFGMVEQWDTSEIGVLGVSGRASSTNIDAASYVPPVLTKTWFHTGVHTDSDVVSSHFAAHYYRTPIRADQQAEPLLLPDSVLPAGLTLDEERQACRALKGAMLRQEIYGLDGSPQAAHPYTVVEQNFTVAVLQRQGENRHAVFHTHGREALTSSYERNPLDPRTTHAMTLAVDDYGNVRTSAAIAYGRLQPDSTLAQADHDRQRQSHITCEQHDFTNAIDTADAYRTPLVCESRTYELTDPDLAIPGSRATFDAVATAIAGAAVISYETAADLNRSEKRVIAHLRTRYRPDDLGASHGDVLALLAPRQLESRALPGERYQLALTSGLVTGAFGRRVSEACLTEGGYRHSDGDADWWVPSGRVFLSPRAGDSPTAEFDEARHHFFLTRRVRDPFHRPGFDTEQVVTYDAHDLLVRETRDALGNLVTATHDYRVLQPRLVADANGNRSEVIYDALGLVVGSAVMGKEGEPVGDSLTGVNPDPDAATIAAHFDDPLIGAHALLGGASTRLVYDLYAYQRTRSEAQPYPAAVYTLSRDTHDADLEHGELPRLQHLCTFSDGFGREIQKKGFVEPGPLSEGGADHTLRWVGSGWTVFDNKGNPVRQYEPFFTPTHRFELARTEGVSPTFFYDPVGRLVATLNPDHTWQKVVFDQWREETWDASDTLLESSPADAADVGDYFRRLPDTDYLPTWHAIRASGALGTHERDAARASEVHAATPSISHLDALGRRFLTVEHNRVGPRDAPATAPPLDASHATRVAFDIQGRHTEVIDALARPVARYEYDLLNRRIRSRSMEAGERWTLADVAGRVRYAWDSRDHCRHTAYDQLGRPTDVHLQRGADIETLVGRVEYGESQPDAAAHNLRGKPYRSFDEAGVVTTRDYDFKGNALVTSRQLTVVYASQPDWSTNVGLETEVFTTRRTFDARNRVTTVTTPDSSVGRHAYNEAGLLEAIDVNIRGDAAQSEPVWTPFVLDIDYDAKGQRTRVAYGNGVVTTFEYDPQTFRLIRLRTFHGDDVLQDLAYTYDPVGNITHIEDSVQPDVFFRNQRVAASQDFRYDAIRQLVEATGREHLGQLNGQAGAPVAPDPFNVFHVGQEHPGDGLAVGRYIERYAYDAVGNFLEMQHVGSDPAHPGWTRTYGYQEPSQLGGDTVSNRLSWTEVGGGPVDRYTYDAHGNMATMPHLPVMQWNDRDQLTASSRQVADEGTAETTWYVYDSSGQRVRKVTNRAAAAGEPTRRLRERIYLGGIELYREYVGDAISLERETLHVSDGAQRVALVETRTSGSDGSPERLTRYQAGNHAGSVVLELDEAGGVVSYEEYFPFGGTSYQATAAGVRTAGKRFRYTSMERDEESGLTYHTTRYCASWLGRWTSSDPLGLVDGPCTFRYARNNPIAYVDPRGGEAFNAGERLSTFTDEFGNQLVEFRAKEGTWISAAATSVGMDQAFTKEQGYGAYVPGVVLNSQGLQFANTDKLEVGEVFYIRVGSGGRVSEPPAPDPQQEPAEKLPPVAPEGWGKYVFRNAIDLVVPDKFAIEAQIEGGGGAEYYIGAALTASVGGSASVILNPNSPDFLKAAINPIGGVEVTGKAGAEWGGGPQGGGGISIGLGEHFGDSREATIASLPGPQYGIGWGAEGKAIGGVEIADALSVSGKGIHDFWGDAAVGVSASAEAAAGIAAIGTLSVKQVYPAIDTYDLLPEALRAYHATYYEWIHSGRQ